MLCCVALTYRVTPPQQLPKRSAMEQLSLSLFDLPSPYAHVWEGLAAQQRAVVLEILARMIIQSVQTHAHAQEATSHE
jgi:hypothetical protein